MLELLLVVVFCAFIFKWYWSRQREKFPPGPLRLPLIGSLLSVLWIDAKLPYLAFHKLSKKYGPILGLKMGSVKTVVINGSAMLNHVANSEHLLSKLDKSDSWLLEKTESIPLGLIFNLPEAWIRTRAFSYKVLKKYGFGFTGVGRTNQFVMEEIVDLCDSLKGQMTNDQVILSITDQFNEFSFNIIWKFLTGKTYGMIGNMGSQIRRGADDFIRASKFSGSIVQIFPKFIHIFPQLTGFNNLKKICSIWRQNILSVINEAEDCGAYKTNPSNFLEEFLHKVKTTPRDVDPYGVFTKDNIVGTFQDFALGGADTQSITTKYFIRHIMEHQDVQEKLHEEISRVVGDTHLVCPDDLPNLKYVQATLLETLRLANPAPLVIRKLLENWEIEGYVIPKGTLVVLNIWSGDNDETVYKDASSFRPSRFLSEDGSLQKNASKKLHVFGFGKRRCIAEHLSLTWLTLLFTTLIQKFSFHVDPAFGSNWGQEVVGITRLPAPFNVIIKSREN